MASTSRLVLSFTGANKDSNFSYNYVDPETPTAKVKSLMQGLIANGSIFQNPPLTPLAAKIVTTTTTDYDLSD